MFFLQQLLSLYFMELLDKINIVQHLEILMETTVMKVMKEVQMEKLDLWRKLYQEFQEMTTPSLLMFQKQHSFVRDLWKEDIMLIQKLSVKHFIFVVVMEMVALLNTAFYVPMEQFFNNNTLYVTGGSMWTVLLLNHCTL